MGIDCSNILNFKTEHMRMCRSNITDCISCPFYNEIKNCIPMHIRFDAIKKEHIEALQKWSDEHPCKTLLEDFLEKSPNIQMEGDGTPADLCPDDLGYEKSDEFCGKENGCQICWNRTVEEVEKE